MKPDGIFGIAFPLFADNNLRLNLGGYEGEFN
jgi:hypothetical protein